MALISLNSPVSWPGLALNITGSSGLVTATTLGTVGHYVAYALCAKEDMTISHVGFRAGAATGSPTMDITVETISTTTGLPTGTLWATNTSANTGTITTNTNVLTALTASASVLRGQVFCVKLALAAGTSQAIQCLSSNVSPSQSSLPYTINNTGTPTRAVTSVVPTLALGSSSTTFYQLPGFFPASAATGGAFNNTNSARRGLRFTIPMSCRATGIRWWNNNTTGDYNAILFNDAGTELSSSSTAFSGNHSAAAAAGIVNVYFDNPVTLTAGSTYRIAIEPSSATNVNVSTYTVPSTDYRSATPIGTAGHYTSFTTGVWDDTNTTLVPQMDVLLDQFDNGVSSGGGGGIIGA